MSDPIKVFVRVRPIIQEDNTTSSNNETSVILPVTEVKAPAWFPKNMPYRPFIRVERGPYDRREYAFDGAFD